MEHHDDAADFSEEATTEALREAFEREGEGRIGPWLQGVVASVAALAGLLILSRASDHGLGTLGLVLLAVGALALVRLVHVHTDYSRAD